MGLAGDDNFHVKVSGNGSTWTIGGIFGPDGAGACADAFATGQTVNASATKRMTRHGFMAVFFQAGVGSGAGADIVTDRPAR